MKVLLRLACGCFYSQAGRYFEPNANDHKSYWTGIPKGQISTLYKIKTTQQTEIIDLCFVAGDYVREICQHTNCIPQSITEVNTDYVT